MSEGSCVPPPATGRRTLAFFVFALIVGLWPIARLIAEEESGVYVQLAKADAKLNTTYTRVMNALPPASREQLRRAQRAWITFVEKYESALGRNSAGREEIGRFKLTETLVREELIQNMIGTKTQVDTPQVLEKFQSADRSLNTAYKSALETSVNDVEAAREAQRAWIIYRDEHARANKDSETWAKFEVTVRRAAQLYVFSMGIHQKEAVEARPSQDDAIVPGKKVHDPFESGR